MKISVNWLRDFVHIPAGTDLKDLAHTFTLHTAEVEHTEDLAALFDNIVVGQIKKIEPHPDADKLKIARTDVGAAAGNGGFLQIVCGGPNIAEGMYVAVALKGARVRWHGQGDLVTMENAKIRGVESFGMICAGEEIGLAPTPDGILDLSTIKPGDNGEYKVGQPLAQALNLNDFIFEIDNKSITHRPDLWGHYGIARELAAITGEKLRTPDTKVDYSASEESKNVLTVSVENKKLCPRYIGVLVENVKIEPSPAWMQKRLETVGYRPISNIVDATNYVMAELGQPMHAFDADKIKGGIVVRTAENKEEIITLDGAARTLTKDMLVIADHENPIAIAGVMGGASSEISNSTTRVILESANFHPASVRKTSTKLGLRTEAVQRFEKSLDPVLAETAMDRLCELILQICPQARIVSPKVDISSFSTKPLTTKLDMDRLRAKIGKDISAEETIRILESLEFKIIKTFGGKTVKKLEVEIPSFRATKDVSMEDDLVEEIARIHGYENITPLLPELPARLPEENTERVLKHRARQIMSYGLGFTEVYNYSFYSKKEIEKALLPEELHEKVENYLSEEQTHMRISLVPNMLKNVAENLKSFPEFKIYEIGRTYRNLQEYFPIEEKFICGMVVESGKKTGEVFYDAKGALEKLLSYYNNTSFEMRKGESHCPCAHPAKYASWYDKATGEEIARVYELHPLVAKNFDLENARIGVFEVNFTLLAAKGFKQSKYRPLAKYPEINFDVSVIVDKKTEIGALENLIRKADRALIRAVSLFDLYAGTSIGEDRKAAAFKITLQSDDRTLTDEEMKRVQQQIFKNLQENGGQIRGL